MRIKNQLKLLLLSLTLFFYSADSFAQFRGDWMVDLGFGLFTRGGLADRYYVADGFAIELHGGGLPHIYNYGIAFNLHPFENKEKHYFILGISKVGGFNRSPDSTFFSERDSLHQLNASMIGINFGYGFNFKTNSSPDSLHYIAAGPSYILKSKRSYINPKREKSFTHQKYLSWTMFLEGGNRYLIGKKRKDIP